MLVVRVLTRALRGMILLAGGDLLKERLAVKWSESAICEKRVRSQEVGQTDRGERRELLCSIRDFDHLSGSQHAADAWIRREVNSNACTQANYLDTAALGSEPFRIGNEEIRSRHRCGDGSRLHLASSNAFW